MAPWHPFRYPIISTILFFSCALSTVWADPKPFDCHVVLNDLKYDLTSLDKEFSLSKEHDTPPTKWRDTIRFNLCSDLKPQDGVAAEDQCPSLTRACLTKTNTKANQDRITHVVPLAGSSSEAITFSAIPLPGKGLRLKFQGSSYPSSDSSEPIPQFISVSLECATETSQPQFKSYDGKEALIDWSSPAACPLGEPSDGGGNSPPPKDDDKTPQPERVGSGVGYFFLLLFLAFVAYFTLGAYYNYSTYGASGTDLIPHRDFWREVPYMLGDVVSHICSTVRPRHSSNRGGYIAV